jgi:hypothetical protein
MFRCPDKNMYITNLNKTKLRCNFMKMALYMEH